MHHEHWSDEAQSFLLARDTKLSELFHYGKYEGTPPLWFLIIKLFLALGGTYGTFFLLPILFSTIGLILFEFKIKAPWQIKVLFPFTYFIFYQYTIVTRSYCMIFPMLMLIAWLYLNRMKKPVLYSIVLLVFMNISLHTLVIAGSFILLFVIDVIQNRQYKNRKIQLATLIMLLAMLGTMLLTIPNPDCAYSANYGTNLWTILSEATIGGNYRKWFGTERIDMVITICLIGIVFLAMKKSKQKLYRLLILIIPVTLILIFLAYQCWHVGIIWLLLFTYFILNDTINQSKIIKYMILVILAVQMVWNIFSIHYDWNNSFSASKEVANFLKENGYDDQVIYGYTYTTTAIEPYFDHTIFANKNTDKAFYFWQKNKRI